MNSELEFFSFQVFLKTSEFLITGIQSLLFSANRPVFSIQSYLFDCFIDGGVSQEEAVKFRTF